MKLSELLTADRILLPMEAKDLRDAIESLARLLSERGALAEEAVGEIIREVVSGEGGDLIRVNEAILLGAAETEGVEELAVALGISPTPFRVDVRGGGKGEATLARSIVLVLTPRRISNLRVQAIPTLVRFFRDSDHARAVLQADGPDEVVALDDLEIVEVHDRLLVSDALTPLQYRVYPDTPMEEVVDLMIRRSLHAVPVVGESHEVLGILTAGDALAHLLPRKLGGEAQQEGPSVAREVMSRSVLCVSEDQPLVEAANTMVNKKVAQLPVVREGELIGFLTRETVLRQLFGR
ncbi:MAG: CBS domain-containing protein [Longimicrobiales bacterium]|nr:CBS domain-containing protein [Longimicrobiales bacterium]